MALGPCAIETTVSHNAVLKSEPATFARESFAIGIAMVGPPIMPGHAFKAVKRWVKVAVAVVSLFLTTSYVSRNFHSRFRADRPGCLRNPRVSGGTR